MAYFNYFSTFESTMKKYKGDYLSFYIQELKSYIRTLASKLYQAAKIAESRISEDWGMTCPFITVGFPNPRISCVKSKGRNGAPEIS